MANDIDMLIEAGEALKERDDICILIVGDGKERSRLEERVRQAALTNVIFTGALPKSRMSEVLAASDACVAILRNIKMFTTTYPNKVFDYMAAGRPTLLLIDGVIRKVIEAAKGGIFVPPGDAVSLASAIETLADDPARACQMGEDARAYVVKHFHRDQHGRELAALLSRLAAGSEA
jgi:glycosyltransferase involved in cell wall biosynthesis